MLGGNLDVEVNPESQDEVAILANTFNAMIGNLRSSKAELLDAYDKTLEGWTKALELKDRETEGHTQRVTEMTVELAQQMGFKGQELDQLRRGALLHDIGKVGIPDSILKKPGKLTDEEYETIKFHPQYAYEMLSQISFLKPAIDIPYCHHERWDGNGYPRGSKAKKYPSPPESSLSWMYGMRSLQTASTVRRCHSKWHLILSIEKIIPILIHKWLRSS